MLSVAVARSYSDSNAIRYVTYVLPVLWITSCFHNGANGPESKIRPVRQVVVSGKVCRLRLHVVRYVDLLHLVDNCDIP